MQFKEIKTQEPPQYSSTTYAISGKIMYVLSILFMIIGIPTFLFGGFICVIIGLLCFYAGKVYTKKSNEKKGEE